MQFLFWVLELLLLTLLLPLSRGLVARFEINEEVPGDTLVGSLTTHLPPFSGNLVYIKVANPKDASKYFSVDKYSGKITVAARLDRETLCTSFSRRQEENCELQFSVSCLAAAAADDDRRRVTGSAAVFAVVDVVVTLRDTNDNGCRFVPADTQTVTIREDADVDQTRIRLYIPEDPDSALLGHSVQWDQITLEDQSGNPSPVFILHKTSIDSSALTYPLSPHINHEKVHLFLGLLKPLDYEQTKEYHLFVNANDGYGDDRHSCRLAVNVEVEDVNDNLPVFEKAVYNVVVAENTPFDQIIVTVTAQDADAGEFGRVFYVLDPFLTDSTTLSLFRINEQTGDIFLKNRLNFLDASRYQMTVRAKNHLHSKPWTSNKNEPDSVQLGSSRSFLTTVIVTVTDVNDHAPRIHIFSPTGSDKLTLTEGLPSGRDVAVVSVTDEDAGRNAKVDCRLKDQSIRGALVLKQMEIEGIKEDLSSGRKYKILAVHSFDREQHLEVHFSVECWDDGEPVMRTIQKGTIDILDVNDNAPVFDKKEYNLEVYEDSQAIRSERGFQIGNLRATDADAGDNAKLQYRFASDCPLTFHELVKVDPETGTLHSTGRLDRETHTLLKCKAIVTDSGLPPLSSSVEVQIKILDINDNAPMFDKQEYTFQLPENSPVGSLVGVLRVFDPDLDVNSRVEFTVEHKKNIWPAHTDVESFFSSSTHTSDSNIHLNSTNSQIPFLRLEVLPLKSRPSANYASNWTIPNSGGSLYEARLFTSMPVDREALLKVASSQDTGKFGAGFPSSSFGIGVVSTANSTSPSAAMVRFKIRAQDYGSPRLAQRATVNVAITDVNDNYPFFIFPPPNTVNTTEVRLSIKEPVGFQFTKVSAYDTDAEENGTVRFRIRAGDPFDLFQMNSDTGELFVAKPYTSGFLGNYLLFIEATDRGSPSLTSETKLRIIVDDSPPLGQVERDIFGFPLSLFSSDAAASRSMNLYIIIAIIVASFVISTVLLLAICLVIRRARRDTRYQQVNQAGAIYNGAVGTDMNGFIKAIPIPINSSNYTRSDTVEDEEQSETQYHYLTTQISSSNAYPFDDGSNCFQPSYRTHDRTGLMAPNLCHSVLHEIPKFAILPNGQVDMNPAMKVTNLTAQTLGRCSAQGPKKLAEDRLNGKRNSLTSADRDSGNGDSLDVAASQPCNLSYGTRFFTLNGGGTVIGIPAHQSIERTTVINKCGSLYGGLTAAVSGATTQTGGVLGSSTQFTDAYTIPGSQKGVCGLISGEPGDQYIALELRPTPQSQTETTSTTPTPCGPGSPCTLHYLASHSNERSNVAITSQQQQQQSQRIDLRESFSLEKLTTTFV
ncbi:hypothetical protein AAHC03_0646 [Spirometra sp. Aus1]